jgi:ABC-type multidrug transport system fused ATPase/permease subunit
LPAKARRKLGIAVLLQSVLSVADLIGIALIGLVVLLGTSSLDQESPSYPGIMNSIFPSELTLSVSLIVTLAALAGFLLVTKTLASYMITRRIFRFLARQQAQVSTGLVSMLLRKPQLELESSSSQDLGMAVTRGVNAVTLGVLGSAVVFGSELTLVILLLLGLLFVNWQLTVFAGIFFLGVAWLMQKVLSSWANNLGKDSMQLETASLITIQESIQSYREVTVLGRRHHFIESFGQLRQRASGIQADFHLMNIVSKYIYEIALILGGGLLAASQLLTQPLPQALTIIALFLASSSRLIPSLMRMQQSVLTIRSSGGEGSSALTLAKWLGYPSHDGQLTSTLKPLPGIRPSHLMGAAIQVKQVCFSYPDARGLAINDVKLAIPAGNSLAVVGSSGAGKSTLVDLILGVMHPHQGSILIDGVEPSLLSESRPGYLAYVPQKVSLINSSLRNNIALALNPDAVTDEEIWSTLEVVGLVDLVRDRGGLDIPVGEFGSRLSGGQLQRIGLARALLQNPSVLVLDEATSALDSESEQLITSALHALHGKTTLVIVAHRLATIRECDSVAFLSSGRVIASGTFEEVSSSLPDFNRQARLLGLI